ncbi:MAG: serine/threonine-protein phosphatase [Flavobacteriales bacterium]|nr:serine/threonine-protein phosphatase [Flavobacteriales bacterium]
MPTSRKVLLAIYALVLTLCTGFIAWSHDSTYSSLRNASLTHLGSITSTLAGQIEGSHVQRLLDKYGSRGSVIKNTQDAWYYVIHDHLRKAAVKNGLERPVLVLSYDSLDQELQIVATSDDKPRFRERFDKGQGHLLGGYFKGGRVDPEQASALGDLMAFDTIVDGKGRVAGIVLAETPLAAVHAEAIHQLWRNIAVTVGAFLLLGLLLFTSVGRWLRQQERDHSDLLARHGHVTDSIQYVRKIQNALIPSPEVYAAQFRDFFVMHRPKDLVSGDFHWYHRIGPDRCLVAAADCTGHGLPGAMLAGIGCSLLNELVTTAPERDPSELLHLLNQRLIETLHQQGRRLGAGDGMDVALCRIDRATNEVLFAGAFRPLYWVHQGQLTVINGDRRPIGGAHHGDDRHFTCHRLSVKQGDRLYLFSDGYIDQLGGPEHQRFMTKRFDDLVMHHQHLPLRDQGEVLERAFLDWKGATEQVDDVCVLGLEV